MFNQLLVLLEQPTPPVPVTPIISTSGGGAEIYPYPRHQPKLDFQLKQGFVVTGTVARLERLNYPIRGIITRTSKTILPIHGTVTRAEVFTYPSRGRISEQRTIRYPIHGKVAETRSIRIPVRGRVSKAFQLRLQATGIVQSNLSEATQELRYLAEKKRRKR